VCARVITSERNSVTKRTGTGIVFGYSGERSSSDLEGMCGSCASRMLTTAIRLDLIVHDGERETEAMDGDVECRFAVFLQLHCAVKVECV
jgi:hypothetical protein